MLPSALVFPNIGATKLAWTSARQLGLQFRIGRADKAIGPKRGYDRLLTMLWYSIDHTVFAMTANGG